MPEPIVRDWLTSVTDFAVRHHVTRLVYSHPLGATLFMNAMQDWFRHTKALNQQGRFRWFTMTQMANFLNRRKQVRWSMVHDTGNSVLLDATHPQNLAQFTWLLPHDRYSHPHVTEGHANIRAADGFWLITAGDGKRLTVEMTAQ
jgi:hypothetical protein